MDLSIIVATYGRPQKLERLIQSISNAKLPTIKWEIIIAYNGVKEDEKKYILKNLGQFSLPLTVLMDSTRGKSRALNKGIQKSSGEYVAFLDDDAEVHKDYLTEIEKAIKTLPSNVFGGRVLPIWPSGNLKSWMTGDKKLQTTRGPIVVHDYGEQICKYNKNMVVPIGCNFFCKKNLFEKYAINFDILLGPGSGEGPMGGEETKVLKTFQSHGEEIIYLPKVAVDHPVATERLTKKYFRWRMFSSGKSRPYVVKGQLPSILGVPRYIFKLTAKEAVLFFSSLLRFNYLRAFEHELNVFNHCGAMYQYLVLRCRKGKL